MENRILKYILTACVGSLLSFSIVNASRAVTLSSVPLFLNAPVAPIVMLNMSKDHQLFFKAYDDYSDANNDGVLDITYNHAIDYYGYFDSQKCYVYRNNRYEPSRVKVDKYCNDSSAAGEWSGNFLNWATMTRIDTVRKILYGGLRSTDTDSETVLQRAFLPNDAHSFAKYYRGTDLPKLVGISVTDFSDTSAGGLTICNTTVEGGGLSHNSTSAPLMRVIRGNYSLWAANERWQCRWSGEKSANNGNDSSKTGINAHASSPAKPSSNGGDYNVRVKVCAGASLIGGEKCKAYTSSSGVSTLKPIGLLQTYGDNNLIRFGLITGSYAKSKSGGVLRKNVSSMNDEIDLGTGRFLARPSSGGIIDTLNRLTIFGYDFGDGTYLSSAGDNCSWGRASFNNGQCTNWGNPQAEIFQESLNYLAGRAATSAYNVGSDDKIPGLFSPAWTAPVNSANSCAPLNIIQFNASTTSYDGDELSDFGAPTVRTNQVGAGESINGGKFFVGKSGGANDGLCTPKTVENLSAISGTCPDAPRLDGTYKIAGLASYARTTDLLPALAGNQKVKTYGVALSPAVPKLEIPLQQGRKISILPACQNITVGGNCAIVDFKVVSASSTSGKLYVNWEDSEQGGDYDQDMWGVIDYTISGSSISVTTQVMAQSTGDRMGFGYVIGGTETDGFHVHSGINGFSFPVDPNPGVGTGTAGSCLSSGTQGRCDRPNLATTRTYVIGNTAAKLLEQPLYYAAKWGGFEDVNNDGKPNTRDEWDADGDGVPDTYFFATNPAQLEESLAKAFEQVAASASSSASVATNSTRLDTETLIYQARFNSNDWSGQLLAYRVAAGGDISVVAWDTNQPGKIPSPGNRNIVTWSGGAGAQLEWSTLSTAQKAALAEAGVNQTLSTAQVALGQARLNWLKGARDQEQPAGALRKRDYLLGDVVNSDPVFVGTQDYGYGRLPLGTPGADSYAAYVASKSSKTPLLLLGANDGMLHAFNATTGVELFAYMPSKVFGDIAKITKPDYGKVSNPHRYFVDGQIFIGDAYINNSWRTVAIGSYGGGYRGVFALDVTNAGTSTGFRPSDVLFELDDVNWADIGHVMSPGIVGRLPDGTWGAVFGNGYNSQGEQAKLLVINLSDVTDRVAIATATSTTPNGLAGPALLANAQRTLIHAYAGDLAGNLWKFAFTGNNSTTRSNWEIAYRSGNTPVPLFRAKNASDEPQPITSVPELGYNPDGNRLMVFFGTGSYFMPQDVVVPISPATHRVESFYGLVDSGSVISQLSANARSSLVAQTITSEVDVGALSLRKISNSSVNYSNKSGWYLDLVKPSASGAGIRQGERVVSTPILRNGRIIFPTLIPSQDVCSAGGDSWLMELDAWSGGRLAYPVFDVNGDGEINDLDLVNGEPVSGKKSRQGIIKTPAIISAGDIEYKFASGTAGGIDVTVEKGGLNEGRLSWRQLR
ncbi:pilus assembly protein [Stutzerimonas stutzeri]|uniref:pilus assembly protein n=1 Tax=Stutzerimonas stutzeri TaxID=316 RepID=UPI00147C0BA6|nr:PilC/PilY family type IV pilus protein [Stutzerimonas stutzeri]WRQ03908.1 PilC/PilY family type IV pilus protein [Stutzerimonas stutzeri]